MRLPPVLLGFGPLVVAMACGSAGSGTAAAGEGSSGLDAPSDSGLSEQSTDGWPAAERGCPPPPGVSARPESVQDVVDLLGALPLPTTLPCFLESLERPLVVTASTNDFSAQPADGPENPRLFIVSGPLTMAVVPTGVGSHLLELAVDVGDRRSLKAELEFPLEARATAATPFERIARGGGGTTCNNCHDDERISDAVGGIQTYTSEALQPPEEDRLSIGFVQQHAAQCDPQDQDPRCRMLIGLFAHGEVDNTSFPSLHRICIGS